MFCEIDGRVEAKTPRQGAIGLAKILQHAKSPTGRWFIWNPSSAEHEDFSLRSLVLEIGSWRTPNEPPSYAIELRPSPDPGVAAAFGFMTMHGGSAELRVIFDLAQLDLAPEDVEGWLAGIVDDDAILRARVGPDELINEEGAGWLTWVRRSSPLALSSFSARQVAGGVLVRAHAGAPEAATEAALDAIRSVSEVLRAGERPAQEAAPAAEGALAVPTYLKQAPGDARSAAQREPQSVDETAAIPLNQIFGDSLPFAGNTTPERLAELATEAEPTEESERYASGQGGSSVDETLMIPVAAALARPKSGTFRDDLTSLVVPILSLEEYADLRAELSVCGEDDPETLKRFGVTSAAAHGALKNRFAEYFARDPAAQQRFLDAMTSKLKARTKKA